LSTANTAELELSQRITNTYYYYYYYCHYTGQPALAGTNSSELENFVGTKFY